MKKEVQFQRSNSAKNAQILPLQPIPILANTQKLPSSQSQRTNIQKNQNLSRQMSAFGYSTMRKTQNQLPQLNLKTIKNISNGEQLHVIPSEVIFRDIKLNQQYETTVVVQNLCKVPKRIKIIQPKTKKFRVDYDTQGAIAAGLSLKLQIYFQTNITEDQSDILTIQYDTDETLQEYQVYLHAYFPQAKIIFEPFVNLGYVKSDSDIIKKLTFKNQGKTAGKVRLQYNYINEITCDPSNFVIQPDQDIEVKMVFKSKANGVFRGKIEVVVEGQSIQKFIDVNATAVEFSKFFIDDQGINSSSFDFGEMFFGEKKIIKAFLVNNTPHNQNYKVKMRIGYHTAANEKVQLQTPMEAGLEQTEQIIKCIPEKGFIKSYSQIPITFICQSKVKFEHQIITKNNALAGEQQRKKEEEEDFTYSAIFDFFSEQTFHDSISLSLIGRGICPKIRISKQIIDFQDCQVNDHREISFTIENKNISSPILITIPRIPQFFVEPSSINLDPGMKTSFVASFLPNSVGRYKSNLFVSLINGQYQIPIQIFGTALDLTTKMHRTRGPESLPNDFQFDKKFVNELQANTQQQQIEFDDFANRVEIPKGIDNKEPNFETLQQLKSMKENKQKYVNMLREQRNQRSLKEKEKMLTIRMSQMEQKLKEKGLSFYRSENDEMEEKDFRKTCPVDIEYELGMVDTKIKTNNEIIPFTKDPLFVLKPIGNYEPLKDEQRKLFNPDPNVPVRKYFPEKAITHKEIRDIQTELTGEMLQKINISPKVLDFGAIYVQSTVSKTFCIKNDLRISIKVQLFTNATELAGTYKKAQIIPCSEMARFEVKLQSNVLNDNFVQNVKFVINDRHEFEFQVRAKIQKVKLELSKQLVKFQFQEESTSMQAIETLKITNSGNSEGEFKWDNSSKIFIVHPRQGIVPSGGSVEISVTYKPSQISGFKENFSGGIRQETDKLVMFITNGQEQILKCEGYVNETKCILRQGAIDLGQLIVGKEENRVFQIKNTSRISAVFNVLTEKLPDDCIVTPISGKIQPDGIQELSVKFCCRDERKVNSDIQILIRGGKVLKLPFTVQTIIPKVYIMEEVFNFGQVTKDNSAYQQMTLINKSEIPAQLILDMRTEEENPDCSDGIGCLRITSLDETDESILRSIHADQDEEDEDAEYNQEQNLLNNQGDIDLYEDDDQSRDSDESVTKSSPHKKFSIVIKPGQTLKFQLTFTPNDAKPYDFELPLILARFGPLPGLIRSIQCRGKDYPENLEVIFSNPERKPVSWRIDDGPLEKLGKVFFIYPKTGKIEPGQSQVIKASFDPKEPLEYEEIIPVYIDGDNQSQPIHKLQIKGVAQYPRLLFDRREILLPVVPVGVESKCIFRIINDGYENLKVKHVVMEELGNFKVDCRFLEGNALNITKSKIRVEVFFISKKPISFTSTIEFKDEQGKSYKISVSGTADNCTFTNFQYYQRLKGEVEVVLNEEKNVLNLEDQGGDDNLSQDKNNRKYAASIASAKTHSSRTSSKSTRSALGYNPVPKEMMDYSKDVIKRWLNFNVLNNNIQNFPDSIIEDNGDQLYELLNFLVGNKSPLLATKSNISNNANRTEKINLLYQQYDQLIRLLKQDGALLNHIRPQFLLGYNDYNSYVKSLNKEENQFIHQTLGKLSSHKYAYFCVDSWICLFYQILKVYYLQRINLKQIKTIPNLHPEKATLPNYYIQGSNFYSQYEGMLLRWLELSEELANQQIQLPYRIVTLEQEIYSGHLLAGLIKNYLGTDFTQQMFQGMKPITNNEDERFFNCTKVYQALQDINLQSPFLPNDISKPSQREIFLLLVHLLNTLPNYIPKGNPIIFSCILGQEVTNIIELKNNTKKPINYWVKYIGSHDFQMETDNVKLDPGETYPFNIKFVSRVSAPVTGRVRFTNKRESNVAAQTLVFDLKSQIVGRISQKVEEVESFLYEQKEFMIKVENKFTNFDHADFLVTIVHDWETKFQSNTNNNNNNNNTNTNNNNNMNKQIQEKTLNRKPQEEVLLPQEVLNAVPAFFCKQNERIRVKKNVPLHLQIVFIPIVLETQKCFVIFSDPNVGEFQYEIIGKVKPPEEIFSLPDQPPIYVDEPRNWQYKIPFKNEKLKDARKLIEYYLFERKKKDNSQNKKYTLPNISPDLTNFYVSIQQPHDCISLTKTLTLVNPMVLAKRKASAATSQIQAKNDVSSVESKKISDNVSNMDQLQVSELEELEKNILNFNFSFKQPYKDYTAIITLKNPEKSDIRIYKLVLQSQPKPIQAIMEIKCPAKELVTQEIPILNYTEKDWMIKVLFIQNEEKNGKAITIQLLKQNQSTAQQQPPQKELKDIQIKKKQTATLLISFAPNWILQAEAHLTLQNLTTNEVYEYEIVGIGEEPLTIDHLVINCQARKLTKQELVLKNPYSDRAITYEVETDLVGASGSQTITIPASKKAIYTLSIMPLLSGQYTGSITFTDTLTGEYVWWTALLNTECPPSSKKIDLITSLRKAVAFDISIANPTNEIVNFEVFFEGEGLIGNPYFVLQPKSTGTYELFFLPLKANKQQGSIAFVSEELGEIWYELNLQADDSQTVRLPLLKTELGKVDQHEIRLENPTNHEAKIQVKIQNPANFDVLPDQIIIPANDEISVYIRYMPSVLDQTQTSLIIFQSENIGKWQFLAFGMGIAPTSFEPKIITVGLDQDISSFIVFKNPFKDSIQVKVYLETDDPACLGVLQLLLKKTKETEDPTIIVQGQTMVQIPFSFTPREIRYYEAQIIVQMNDNIKWRYPIHASTELYSNIVLANFQCKCRVNIQNELKINLPGISELFGEDDIFTYELKNVPKKFKHLIDNSLNIKMTKNYLTSRNDYLLFQCSFHPMKPFKATIDLIINRRRGGLWKFKLQLEGLPPNEDDVIVLSSLLDSIDSVCFKLTNRFKTYAQFIARFTPESDSEFSVSPISGILEPYGREGTTFTVSFQPIEYGQHRNAKLIIETEDMFWSYSLKGILPNYKPPTFTHSKIDNKLGIDVTSNWRHNKTNFVINNIRKSKKKQQENISNIYNNSMNNSKINKFVDTKSLMSTKKGFNFNASNISNMILKN